MQQPIRHTTEQTVIMQNLPNIPSFEDAVGLSGVRGSSNEASYKKMNFASK